MGPKLAATLLRNLADSLGENPDREVLKSRLSGLLVHLGAKGFSTCSECKAEWKPGESELHKSGCIKEKSVDKEPGSAF